MVVSTIPPGSGMIIMSHSNIEAYDNTITGHKTLGIAVNSWLFTGVPFESEEFDPYSTNIHLHDNIITGTEGPTDTTTEYGQLMTGILGGKAYDIIIDGIYKPGSEVDGRVTSYCFTDNGDVSFINLNAGMGATPEDMAKNMDSDMSKFDCSLPIFDTDEHDQWLARN